MCLFQLLKIFFNTNDYYNSFDPVRQLHPDFWWKFYTPELGPNPKKARMF
jgi:hypothetical protein